MDCYCASLCIQYQDMLRTAVVDLVGLTHFIMKAHGHSAVFHIDHYVSVGICWKCYQYELPVVMNVMKPKSLEVTFFGQLM